MQTDSYKEMLKIKIKIFNLYDINDFHESIDSIITWKLK